MTLSESVKKQIENTIHGNDIVVFMKGNRAQPQCGFSATVVEMLNSLVPEYKTVNVLEDPGVREGIKEYSSWPTIPQIYVRGEFIGGCDIMKELYANGEIFEVLGLAKPSTEAPKLVITAPAIAALKTAMGDAGDDEFLRIEISAGYMHELVFGAAQNSDVRIEQDGVCLLLDPMSASRANGLKIDYSETPQGAGFQIDNPNAPPAVKQLSVQELKAMLTRNDNFYFFDVRRPDERETAMIEGSRLFSDVPQSEIDAIAKDAVIVFHCHSGGRSSRMAEQFRAKGYTNLHNVVGGITAWLAEIK